MRRARPEDLELLGVTADVTVEALHEAYQRLATLLAPGSLALYSLLGDRDQREFARRLREAYEAVAADLGVVPVPVPAAEPAPASPQPAQVPPPRQPVGGAALRVAREERGVPLRAIADRTRISVRQLEAIEAERFEEFPFEVYLRGFVIAFARELKLDPEEVWRGYRERWQAARHQ